MTALNQNTDFQKISRSEFETMDCKLIKQEKSGHGPMAQNSIDHYMTGDGRTVVHSHAMGGESFTIAIKKFMTPIEAMKQALDAAEAFTDPLGNMPAQTSEFNELMDIAASLQATEPAKPTVKRCGACDCFMWSDIKHNCPAILKPSGELAKPSGEREVLISELQSLANLPNQLLPIVKRVIDVLAADAQRIAGIKDELDYLKSVCQQEARAVDEDGQTINKLRAEIAELKTRQVAAPQEGVSLLPGKSSDIPIEGLVILDKDMREWAQGHGLHLFYLGSWHVMQGKKWLTVGYESPLKALEACWEGSSLDDALAADHPEEVLAMVPMTNKEIMKNGDTLGLTNSVALWEAFELGVKCSEQHHGIK